MHAATDANQTERALDELMLATDAFVASWTEAVRRFAQEPEALRRLRQDHPADRAELPASRSTPVAALNLLAHPHPLWDRYLDG